MTHEDDIPELVESLEGSLVAPSAAAIHAGLGQRQAARKRMLGAAGAFVAVLVIAGGALALTNDDTSTVTADDTGVAATDSTDSSGELPAVANDSAPRILGLAPATKPDPIETTAFIGDCDSGSLVEVDGSEWVTGQLLPAVWEGLESVPITALLQGDALVAVDDNGNATRFWRVRGSATPQCPKFGNSVSEQVSDLASGTFRIAGALGDLPVDDVVGQLTLGNSGDQQGPLDFNSFCTGAAGYWALWGDTGFTVVDKRPQPPVAERNRCEEPPPRLDVFEKGDEVVTVISPDFISLTVSGKTQWQLILDRSFIGIASLPTLGPDSTPVETTVPPVLNVPPPPTTTAAPAGPPAFAPSADLALSGQWEPVGMWNDGIAVDIADFRGSLQIFGRRLGGRDGCNDHGNGLFYATPDGQVQLQSGTSTAAACIDNELPDLFKAGTFGATQWGRSSAGNLVLTDGVVAVEFELTERVPVGSLTDLAASLDTIWRSERPGDFVNVPPGGSGVTLTFMADFEIGVIAVVTVEDCGEFGFAAVYEDQTEGEISFEPLSDANPTDCELSESAQLTLDALPRADYFATAEGGLGLWDGPAPLAALFGEK